MSVEESADKADEPPCSNEDRYRPRAEQRSICQWVRRRDAVQVHTQRAQDRRGKQGRGDEEQSVLVVSLGAGFVTCVSAGCQRNNGCKGMRSEGCGG